MRFVFSPPATEVSGLLTLPWTQALEDWRDQRMVEIRQRGISRHVVRFVADGGELFALKSISENLARREYRLLRSLAGLSIPAVEVVGVVVDREPAEVTARCPTPCSEPTRVPSRPTWSTPRPASSTRS
jgi:hypothetical protein